MKYNISNNRLKVIVDTLGEEYKDLLIEQLLDEMKETDADVINPSDLIRLDVATKSHLRAEKKAKRMNRMLSLLSSIGILYAFMGLILLLVSELENTIRHDPMMMVSVILIIIGLFVSLLSITFKNTAKVMQPHYRNLNHSISPYQLINKWKEIEALLNQLTPDSIDSLSAMVANLNETGIISNDDVQLINQLLSIRNTIVHVKDPQLPQQEELRSCLQQAEKLIVKMKKLL